MTKDDDIIYNTPHNTCASTINNQTAHRTSDDMTTGMDSDDWIKTHPQHRNVRKECITICEHCDGPSKGDKRVAVARSNIVKTFYINETNFSFKNQFTRLKM